MTTPRANPGLGEVFQSHNPATGEAVTTVRAADAAAVAAAYAEAASAQTAWAGLPFAARAASAERFAERLGVRKGELAGLISAEVGKPAWEAAQEVDTMRRKIPLSIEAYAARTGESCQTTGDTVATVSHAPHGTVAVLGPFNFPGHLPNGHIVPALLAGNAVLFKPSEFAPGVGALMAELWREAGLPAGLLGVLPGGRDTAVEILRHPELRGVFFTGSARTGTGLHRQFAGRPEVILALEMGGNNPMVLLGPRFESEEARVVAASAFLSAGQRCTCTRRLVVVGEVDLDPLLTLARRLVPGAPAENPFMGPVIDAQAARDALEAQAHLRELGGVPLLQMAPPARGLPFLSPGVIDVTDVAQPPDEEIFAPLLQVVRVGTFDEGIAVANRTRYGLAAGLLGGTEADFSLFRRRVRAGVVNWNRPTTGASSAAPFGGIGVSGNGRPSAYYAADYCAYPIASMSGTAPAAPTMPGLEGS